MSFSCILLTFLATCLLVAYPAAAQKRIALTFDDVPRARDSFLTPDERTERLITALREARVPQAAFFVTTGNLDGADGAGGEAHIAAYVAAGHVIANHSHSHLWATRTPVADYLADLDRADRWLEGRPGYRPWYRFPFLDEGRDTPERRDALRGGLRERGLQSGYVTVDSYDWYLDQLVDRAAAAGAAIDRNALRDLYVEMIVGAAEFNEGIARETLGRSPAHVMLLHETDLAALYIADAVAALRARGWEIVSADTAFADPIATEEPDSMFLGGGRIAALANARGRPRAGLVPRWNEESVISALFNERVLRQRVSP
ncbi:polysaccharide deacetylase family protein [Sphingosinicella sp. LHD-64]|uniref:polysaccharide deacetylase family protein n=1 Tax=Sphingosinicella sp. LHD-64 TaxID=3072139 RepID=UPI00280D719E|nr:polysaccharide deacetylase family protein [Sphingosinicella sp. LHD-64]MDQ8757323.1 polysaccharide deacetylase family protein [Sphingosinicella sp. LHD-64]